MDTAVPKVRNFFEAANLVAELVEVKQRQFLLDTWNELVDATPVLTGKARASWFLSPGFPKTIELPDGVYGRPVEPNLAQYKRNHTRWLIANTAPYIAQLNAGNSRQAPAGFVNRIIARNVVNF